MTSTLPQPTEISPDAADTVAVIGAGSIGIAWVVVFASAGIQVRWFEPVAEIRASALAETALKLEDLAAADLLDEPIAAVLDRVTVCDTLEGAVAGAGFVQECVVEDVE